MSAAQAGIFTAWPAGLNAMRAVDAACDAQGMSPALLELVRLWCSVLNDCDFCIDMHSRKSLGLGVPQTLVDDMVNRRDTSGLDDSTQAVMAYASALTTLTNDASLSKAAFALEHFSRKDVITLSYVIAQINAWNRLARAGHTLADQ